MTCPACSGEMMEETFDGHYGRKVTIDLCAGCNGLWFDGMESHQLTPGATLALVRRMGTAVEGASRPLNGRKACPRCSRLLTRALDRQRSTTFETFRCPSGHGRYMTFISFLRAKNFVRDLSALEIAELRRHVQMISCTSCGANVDIRTESACSYCRAPIAMLDPDQLQKTVAALEQAEARRQTVDPALPLLMAQERLRTERVFAELGERTRSDSLAGIRTWNLVEAGISSVARLLDTLATRR